MDLNPEFLAAFGEELSEALTPPVPDDAIVPADGPSVWSEAFPMMPPTPETLACLTASEVAALRDAAARDFEYSDIAVEQIRLAIDRTLARWPVDI